MNLSLLEQCRAYLHAQGSAPFTPATQPVRAVTISRETGAGALTIGELVTSHLQTRQKDASPAWTLFDRNLVEKILADHSLHRTVAQYLPEDAASPVTSTVEELLGLHPSQWTMLHYTSNTILRLAGMGNVVLVGRGAHLVTAHLSHVLHVRLIAPLDQRITHIMAYYKLNRTAAAEFIQLNDQARARYVRKHFKHNVDNPLDYHLTINTGIVPYAEAAGIIGDAVLKLPPYSPAAKKISEPMRRLAIV